MQKNLALLKASNFLRVSRMRGSVRVEYETIVDTPATYRNEI